jgi:uncharacterized membrane protein
MRTTLDRIRQAVSFELIGLVIVIPLGSWLFGFETDEIGVLAVIAATVATGWNYVFNLGFDRLLVRARGHARKTMPLRVLHALAFEAGLLMILMPIIAWWLGITLLEAFLMSSSRLSTSSTLSCSPGRTTRSSPFPQRNRTPKSRARTPDTKSWQERVGRPWRPCLQTSAGWRGHPDPRFLKQGAQPRAAHSFPL